MPPFPPRALQAWTETPLPLPSLSVSLNSYRKTFFFLAVHYQLTFRYTLFNLTTLYRKNQIVSSFSVWPDNSIQLINELYSIIKSKNVFFTILRFVPFKAKCDQRPIVYTALAPVPIGTSVFLCSVHLRFKSLLRLSRIYGLQQHRQPVI
jgi:hypothetical protein